MVSANLNVPSAIYWVIAIIGGVLFCLTDNKSFKSQHSTLGKIIVMLSCIVSGGNGIYRTVIQKESIYITNTLFVVELVLLIIALLLDIRTAGLVAVPYILSRYIIGCLIMCTPISLIVTSKALGGLVGGVAVIIIFYIVCSGGIGTELDDLTTIVLNGESYMVLRQYNSMGGNVIEYRASDGTTKSLSQAGPGSSWYKTEDGRSIRMQANGYFNS